MYFSLPDSTGIRWYNGAEKQSLVAMEVLYLDWAIVLLNLTYGFIEKLESKHVHFLGVIPCLCFVNATAEFQEGPKKKYFLIGEWIDTSKTPFTKYINNGLPSLVYHRMPQLRSKILPTSCALHNMCSFCFQEVQFILLITKVCPQVWLFIFGDLLALGSVCSLH